MILRNVDDPCTHGVEVRQTKQNSPLSRSEQLIIQVPQRPVLFLQGFTLNPSHLHLPRLLRQDRLRLLWHLLESPQTLVLVIHLVMPCSVDIWGNVLFPEGKQEQWEKGGGRGWGWGGGEGAEAAVGMYCMRELKREKNLHRLQLLDFKAQCLHLRADLSRDFFSPLSNVSTDLRFG